jgi:hypothetical protein
MPRQLAALVCVVCVCSSVNAVQLTLDNKALFDAIGIGQSRFERERVAFHQPYRLRVARPPVDWIDVITPFHRVVLAAEARARIGDRVFGQREALAVLSETPGQIDLVVELTFHPQNTFVGIPPYDIALIGPNGTKVQPLRTDRYPRFQARVASPTPELPSPGGAPFVGKGDPVLGGTLVTPFRGAALDPMALYTVVVSEAGKELARVPMDLAKLR